LSIRENIGRDVQTPFVKVFRLINTHLILAFDVPEVGFEEVLAFDVPEVGFEEVLAFDVPELFFEECSATAATN
jgi:hypothetical protein